MRTKNLELHKHPGHALGPEKMQKLSLEILVIKNAMCSPYNSSLIAKEYEDMKNKGMVHDLIDRKSKYMHGMKIKVFWKKLQNK